MLCSRCIFCEWTRQLSRCIDIFPFAVGHSLVFITFISVVLAIIAFLLVSSSFSLSSSLLSSPTLACALGIVVFLESFLSSVSLVSFSSRFLLLLFSLFPSLCDPVPPHAHPPPWPPFGECRLSARLASHVRVSW